MAAQALRAGIKTDYHTFTHIPDAIRESISKLGLDVKTFEEDDTFRIWDSYTVQTGLGLPRKVGTASPRDWIDTRSVNIEDWDKGVADEIRGETPETEKRRIHIDDDTSVLLRFNDERKVVEHFRTLTVPFTRKLEMAAIHSVLVGAFSQNLLRQFESFCDGIIDFRSTEEGHGLNHMMRVRIMRGKVHDSRWVKLELMPNGEVRAALESTTSHGITSDWRSARDGMTDLPIGETVSLLTQISDLTLSRYRVVGSYSRFEESARNLLKDLKQRILNDLNSPSPLQTNYMMWSRPGGGKTFFVQQLAATLTPRVIYNEVNLTLLDAESLSTELSKANRSNKPSILFVDEVDARKAQEWAYEVLLPHLEGQATAGSSRVFILAGSSGENIGTMKESIGARPKGSDLLSRIPARNEYSIPPMTAGDRLVVALSTLKAAAKERGKEISDVEKVALYYIGLNPTLSSARQLRDFSRMCVHRLPTGEERIKYDSLFDPGDQENKDFWAKTRSTVPQFINSFVRVND